MKRFAPLTAALAVAMFAGNLAQAAEPAAMTYRTWTEPHENAFTVQVPRGWKVTGGMFRYAPIDVRPQVDAGTTDGRVHLRFGDANLATFAVPGPSSQIRGLSEGQSYPVNGVPYVVMRFVNGAEFSRAYVERKIAKQHADLRITATRELNDEADQATRAARGQGLPVRDTVGETEFTYTMNGRTMRGVCHVRTEIWGEGIGQVWHAFPDVYTATPDRFAEAKSVAARMIRSTKEEPRWAAQTRATAAAFNRLIMRNHEAAMQTIHDTYAKFTRSMDENQRQWSNIINGETDVVNPETGETAKAQGLNNYYYQNGSKIVGNDSGNLPGPGYTQIRRY